MKITKNTKAGDALEMSDAVKKIFEKHNLYCPGCKGLDEDTIEKIAVCNGMDLQEFLDELNSSLD